MSSNSHFITVPPVLHHSNDVDPSSELFQSISTPYLTSLLSFAFDDPFGFVATHNDHEVACCLYVMRQALRGYLLAEQSLPSDDEADFRPHVEGWV